MIQDFFGGIALLVFVIGYVMINTVKEALKSDRTEEPQDQISTL